MNNKGFTLIELIASVLLLAVLMTITATSVVSIIQNSKDKSYELLIGNIKVGAQGFFEECENQEADSSTIENCPGRIVDASNTSFKIQNFTITLGDLLNYGFLKSSSVKENGGKEVKIVENPKTNEDISNCTIKITKKIDRTNYATSYLVERVSENISVGDSVVSCPSY